MTLKILIVSAFLGMAATVPAFALEGRGVVKASGANSRPITAAAPTPPLHAPKSPVIPLAEPYTILNTLSIFAVDHRSAEGRTTGTEQFGVARPTRPSTPVFRGVMIDDNGPLALMEVSDAKGGTSNEYWREGQTVLWSNSKVLSITLENLRLSRTSANAWQNSWVDIPIGCNLNGVPMGTLPLAAGTMASRPERQRSILMEPFGLGGGYNRDTTAISVPLDQPRPPG